MQTTRKAYGLMLLILMLMGSLTITAAQATTVSIPEITTPAGSYVTLPVTLNDVQSYGTGTINITYDSSVVHVTGVANGPYSTINAWNLAGVSGWYHFCKRHLQCSW
ncbi:MAG: cohesin domain-containing protein [Methanocellales archaeon]|nr:cohesin domain-containing protein [Methanocellales archaeon]